MPRAANTYRPLAAASFDGQSMAPRQVYGGVLTRPSTARYRLTFTTPLATANYLVAGGTDRSAAVIDPNNCGTLSVIAQTTTYVEFTTQYANGFLYEFENVNIMVWDEDIAFYNSGVYKPIAAAYLDGQSNTVLIDYGCSITIVGTGSFELTFDTPQADTNYLITVCGGDATAGDMRSVNIATVSTTKVVFSTTSSNGVPADGEFIHIQVWPGTISGYTGQRPFAAAKFNGSVGTIASPSILWGGLLSRNDVGDYSITFTVAQASDNYYIIGAAGHSGSLTNQAMFCPARYQTNAGRFTVNFANGGGLDASLIHVLMWPDPNSGTEAAAIEAEQAMVMAVVREPAIYASVFQMRMMVLARVPAVEIAVDNLFLTVPARVTAPIHVEQTRIMAVARGRVANPRLRVWTFPLDGHDFYVLRLGDVETMLYDTHSEAWTVWGSGRSNIWRANSGCPWGGATWLARGFASSVVVGDDTHGVIYFLDPEYPYDDAYVGFDPTAFPRVAQGQIVHRGRDPIDCFGVLLTGSFGDATFADVTLSYSDDAANTYVDAGTVSVGATDYAARIEWPSLGLINPPGRLFMIEDEGALQRIDGLEMVDAES